MLQSHVLVVGDIVKDILVKFDGDIVQGSDRRAKIVQKHGGSGANQAVWLAAQGASVKLAGRVGIQEKRALSNYFKKANVQPFLIGDEEALTGALICLVDGHGERSFLTDRGANRNLQSGDLPHRLLKDVSVLHVSGYALFDEGPRNAVLELIAEAKRRHISISIDPASTGFLSEVGPQSFLKWIEGADYFFPNLDEASLLTGQINPEAQMAALCEKFGTVILKRGRLGASLAKKNLPVVVQEGICVDTVDTTGAGDAFLAGFIAAKMRGAGDAVALNHAVEAGANAVTQLGAQPNIEA